MADNSATKTIDSDILVRDIDGQYKVYQQGNLSPIEQTADVAGPSFARPALTPASEHFLALPSGSAKPDEAAAFAFHPDDDQEIKQELDKINALLADSQQKKYSLEKIVSKLIEKNKLNLSPDRQRRFLSVIFSYFRHSRSSTHVRALLSEKSDVGIGLSEQEVEAIMSVVPILRQKIEEVEGLVIREEDMPSPPAATEPAAARPLTETAPSPAPVTPDAVTEMKASEKPEIQVTSQPPVAEPVSVTPLTAVVESAGNDLPKVQRPAVTEMKLPSMPPNRKFAPAKVMGKIDELAEMSLSQFRQIDPDPRMAAAKILQRINTLEKDSLLRKAQGIEAWRKNSLYALYLRMGQLSLEQHKDIAAISAALSASNEECLTPVEFEAITDLNKYLRF